MSITEKPNYLNSISGHILVCATIPNENPETLKLRNDWPNLTRAVVPSWIESDPSQWEDSVYERINEKGGVDEVARCLEISTNRDPKIVSTTLGKFIRLRMIDYLACTPEIILEAEKQLNEIEKRKGLSTDEAERKEQTNNIAKNIAEKRLKKSGIPTEYTKKLQQEEETITQLVASGEYDRILEHCLHKSDKTAEALGEAVAEEISLNHQLSFGNIRTNQALSLINLLPPISLKKLVKNAIAQQLIGELSATVTKEDVLLLLRSREAERLTKMYLNKYPEASSITHAQIVELLTSVSSPQPRMKSESPGALLGGRVPDLDKALDSLPKAISDVETLCTEPRKCLCRLPSVPQTDEDSARAILTILTNRNISQSGRKTHLSADQEKEIYSKILTAVRQRQPLDVIFHWPMAKVPNPYKCIGQMPDAAEIAGIQRLLDLKYTLRQARPSSLYDPSLPTIRIHLINEAFAFPFVPGWTNEYLTQFENEMLNLIALCGGNNAVTFHRMDNLLWGSPEDKLAWEKFRTAQLKRYKEVMSLHSDEAFERRIQAATYTFIIGLDPKDLTGDPSISTLDLSKIYNYAHQTLIEGASKPCVPEDYLQEIYLTMRAVAQKIAMLYIITMDARHNSPTYKKLESTAIWPTQVDKPSIVLHLPNKESIVIPAHGHGVLTKKGVFVVRHALNILSEDGNGQRKYRRVCNTDDRLLYFEEV